jgi:hypothetical protein
MKSVSIFLSVIACSVANFARAGQAAPTNTPSRCTTFAATPWAAGPNPRVRIEAFSDGPSCAKAVAVIVVRDVLGSVLYSDSYQTQFVLPLSEARSRTQLQAALQNWMTGVNGASLKNNLPDWVRGATAPIEKEFGFSPAEGITRDDYLAIKSGRAPLLCYVQGMESIKCLVYRNGGFQDFGIQAFPG